MLKIKKTFSADPNYPNKIKPNQVKDNLIYFPDVMPTLAEYAKAKAPSDVDGQSLKPLFEGEDTFNDNRILYWEFPGKQVAIRKGKWKAVTIKMDSPLELYNIESDPYETHNLANDYPHILDNLREEMSKMRVDSPYWPSKMEEE